MKTGDVAPGGCSGSNGGRVRLVKGPENRRSKPPDLSAPWLCLIFDTVAVWIMENKTAFQQQHRRCKDRAFCSAAGLRRQRRRRQQQQLVPPLHRCKKAPMAWEDFPGQNPGHLWRGSTRFGLAFFKLMSGRPFFFLNLFYYHRCQVITKRGSREPVKGFKPKSGTQPGPERLQGGMKGGSCE